ncbi:MAG: glycoside hydrolase [Candidatus Thorarchaeota archaeon]|nr:glycoside hydrolase [Candidatus Thorarchaeota archaeon]
MLRRTLLVLVLVLLVISPALQSSEKYINSIRMESVALQDSSIETIPEVSGFSSNVLLSTDDSSYPHHVEVSMTISDNGTLFAGWKESNTHNGPGIRVSIIKSVDGGITWTSPYSMPMFTSGTTGQSDPWLAWYDGTVYYTYLEYSIAGPSLSQITVARSDNYGASWTPVTASYGAFFADKEMMVISDNGTIYVVYDDTDDATIIGNTTIRLTRSTDGGITFHEICNITEQTPWKGLPYMALSSESHLYVVWLYLEPETLNWGNIELSKSLDGGSTFQESQFINSDGNYSTSAPGKITLPVVRFDQNDRLYVLWADGFDGGENSFDVYLRYSDDYGDTWSDRLRVNPTVQGNQWNPEMFIDTYGKLHIVYYDEQGGYYRPYYRSITFVGDEHDNPVLGNPIPIADLQTSSSFTRPGEYMSIQMDSNGVLHIVWTDGRNDEMDIFYAHGIYGVTIPLESSIILAGMTIMVIAGIAFYIRRRYRV